ncbi:FUSC family protein [Shewanella subflava]|uniref:FUSC family protein n=1 Tax=Shewanella subflava TaxID=2986476 RepID=A0ABT3IB95_9GAMM|nr:FUSC family protein [Shewanella subflava]MCW3173328.1 FUSC family protein [Shewanella subflava]
MLSFTTKDALKVAISFVISIVLSLYFGWEKPYWAAVTIVVLASNETYGQSLKVARERLMGTLAGAIIAIILIAFFSQDRLLFIGIYLILAAIATYMAFDPKHGYAYRMSFIVCTMITAVGSFDDFTSFSMIILRLQETLLGIVVYSLVYRFVWPNSTENYFFTLLDKVLLELKTYCIQLNDAISIEDGQKLVEKLAHTQQQIAKMEMLLDLPLSGSYRLSNQLKKWQSCTIASYEIAQKLNHFAVQDPKQETTTKVTSNDLDEIQRKLALLQEGVKNDERPMGQLSLTKSWHDLTNLSPMESSRNRLINAMMSFIIIGCCFGAWIYIPIMGSYMFPLLSSILAVSIMTMPKGLIKPAATVTFNTSVIILIEYVFLMPYFTELWQLCLFYFINIFAIWRICSTPALALYKLLGGNFVVILTMSALNLTPSYSIETPLNTLIMLFLIFGIISFFENLSKPLYK